MNDSTFHRPVSGPYSLNVEKFCGQRESECASVSDDGGYSIMIGLHTVQVLPEFSDTERDLRTECEGDPVEHKYCRCCGKALFPS